MGWDWNYYPVIDWQLLISTVHQSEGIRMLLKTIKLACPHYFHSLQHWKWSPIADKTLDLIAEDNWLIIAIHHLNYTISLRYISWMSCPLWPRDNTTMFKMIYAFCIPWNSKYFIFDQLLFIGNILLVS